jgi:hypothetical protein
VTGRGLSSRGYTRDLGKISPFGRNDMLLVLCGLGGFAGDIPRFGCNTTALFAPPACQNRYFQILKIVTLKGTADEICHDQT